MIEPTLDELNERYCIALEQIVEKLILEAYKHPDLRACHDQMGAEDVKSTLRRNLIAEIEEQM